MFKQSRLLCSFLCLCFGGLSAATAGDAKKSNLITHAGEYKFFGARDQLALKVKIDKGNVYAVMHSALRPQSENTFLLSAKDGPYWVIYVEAPNRLWLFRGVTLTKLELEELAVKSTPVRGVDVIEWAPKTLLESLPKDVRKTLEAR